MFFFINIIIFSIAKDTFSFSHPVNASFSDKIVLLGYDINKKKIRIGDTLQIIWYWKCNEEIPGKYFIWVRFVNRWGTPVIAKDREIDPLIGEIIPDTCQFVWPEECKKGKYGLIIIGGVYFVEKMRHYLKILPSRGLRIYRKKCLVLDRIIVE
jgi:hypothetical protein